LVETVVVSFCLVDMAASPGKTRAKIFVLEPDGKGPPIRDPAARGVCLMMLDLTDCYEAKVGNTYPHTPVKAEIELANSV
jgi:hypothetical protein